MDFVTAVKTCFSKYATFHGTAHRPEYWWFVLFLVLGSFAFAVLDGLLFGDNQPLGALFSLGTLLPILAAGARRLHDVGRSGWWLLLGLIPILGTLVLLYWFIQPAKTGDNPFA
jgi:uncharacterized membrane protein YhaH (DUF805 family)